MKKTQTKRQEPASSDTTLTREGPSVDVAKDTKANEKKTTRDNVVKLEFVKVKEAYKILGYIGRAAVIARSFRNMKTGEASTGESQWATVCIESARPNADSIELVDNAYVRIVRGGKEMCWPLDCIHFFVSKF